MKLGDDSGSCDASKAGAIRWSGSSFEGCNGTNWIVFMPTTGLNYSSTAGQKITFPYEFFGSSVSVSGSIALIGAMRTNSRSGASGAAYLFTRAADGTWNKTQKLTAEDGADGDLFGFSVAVSGSTALIGARADDDKGIDSGSVYVFTRAADGTWSQTQKLTAEDGAAGDDFGQSVSVSGSTALIGAPFDDDNKGRDFGSAYVFTRAADGTWSQTQKLTAEDGAIGDHFGFSVSVSGSTALAGAWDDAGGTGFAYVFTRAADGAWSQVQKLTGEDGAAGDNFGKSVSVSGSTALIGAWGNANKAGSAYVFTRAADGAWSQVKKLTGEDGATWDYFGYSVSVSGSTALIGAILDDRGSAYIYNAGW